MAFIKAALRIGPIIEPMPKPAVCSADTLLFSFSISCSLRDLPVSAEYAYLVVRYMADVLLLLMRAPPVPMTKKPTHIIQS